MGFFTDIIRDSQRPVGPIAGAAAPGVTPAKQSLASGNPDSKKTLALWNNSSSRIEKSEQTFWEEDLRQSGGTRGEAQPPKLEERQVVGPSLSENTENSDLAKAPEQKSSFPDIEKQKQAGLKNHRAVTVQMSRDQKLHDSVSFGREHPGLKDSSVVESEAKHPGQSARGKSVDVTHRSGQAGQTIRAGATTPPDSNGDAPAAPFPGYFAGELTRKVKTAGQISAAPNERLEPQGARQETSALAASTLAEEVDSRKSHAFFSTEAEGMADRHSFEPPGSKIRAMPTVTEDALVHSPVEVRFHDRPSSESPLDGRFREPPPEAVRPKPMDEPSGPKVHIGLLEIVVLAAEKQRERGTTTPSEGQNFASHHYLRNF